MKSITVLGGGESGVGAALLAKKKNIAVFVSDYGTIAEKYKKELQENNIPFEEKGHDFERILTTDIIVKSPGIPDSSEIINKLRLRHKEIISEIELASRFYNGKLIGVTGSNGKTTTTSWIYHILKESDMRVGIGGNIGYSFARLLSTEKLYDWIVLELSSFQLENILSFSAEIAIVLNITPDHLDRYDYVMYKYASAKWNLAESLQSDNHLILNGDDEWTKVMMEASPPVCNVYVIPSNKKSVASKEVANMIEIESNIKLYGRHNVFNGTVAAKVAQLVGIEGKQIEKGLRTFIAIEHRLESVAIINGIEYINDSKATNTDSVKVALEAMTRPVIWIAGGTDKGNDYSTLFTLVEEKVKAIVCLTKDSDKLKTAFSGIVKSIETTENVDKCVALATEQAEEGDVVLLSPACASFDLFNNYEHRGNAFKESVRKNISE